ncbi:unnamed protein product [Menidia menidia]|uniref:(Atlantic silverside) hypothetical protein n=1 Tax=Menidia menidia TaxID=238744 RepID=A0A8S4B9D6_9TELE|nr:unnamed protein product [Menidia menidia]
MNTTPHKPKTASEHRKSSKPRMEKRRRASINESLAQLKTLILDALGKASSRHSKLDKADILEMTVQHLQNLQRAQMTAALNTNLQSWGNIQLGPWDERCMLDNDLTFDENPFELGGDMAIKDGPCACTLLNKLYCQLTKTSPIEILVTKNPQTGGLSQGHSHLQNDRA